MKKFLSLLSCLCLFPTSFAADISILNSKETEYKDSIVICNGNVLVIYDKKIISADKMSFDEKTDILKAKGNVIVKDETGNTYFADSFQVGKNFKSGHAVNLKIITPDKTRLASNDCTIIDGEYLLKDVVFTPCYECTGSGALTWQLKSETVTFNPESYTTYQDAILEAYDVPVLYTPYLSHVSSNLRRKSGFLRPSYSLASQVGFAFSIPYLFSISDSQELIFKPILTSKIGHVPWIYYGLRFPNGEFSIDASLTGTKSVDKKDNNEQVKKIKHSGYRGHFFAKLHYDINNNWRAGFNINRVSDMYYLKRFPFFEDPDRTLESKIYLEGFHGRNYTMIKSSMFQSENMEVTPILLPIIEHDHYFQIFGGTLNVSTAFINQCFKHGRISQKYICNPSWYKEILFPGGHILEINAVLAMQGLKVQEEDRSDYNSYSQALPQINLTWKWPLLVKSSFHNLIFTPLVGTSLAGNKKHYDVFENTFDEVNISNVFSNNRSISPYNVESGKRIFYGFHLDGYNASKNIYHLALGESVELTEPRTRLDCSGLKYKRSNLVGALDIFFNSNLTFSSSASYSRKHSKFTQIEAGINYSNAIFSTHIMWFKGKQCLYNPFKVKQDKVDESKAQKKYKGISFNTSYRINPRTKISGGLILGNRSDAINQTDKTDSGKLKLLKYGAALHFENECAEVSVRYDRINKRGGDLRPDGIFRVVIHLKKFG